MIQGHLFQQLEGVPHTQFPHSANAETLGFQYLLSLSQQSPEKISVCQYGVSYLGKKCNQNKYLPVWWACHQWMKNFVYCMFLHVIRGLIIFNLYYKKQHFEGFILSVRIFTYTVEPC